MNILMVGDVFGDPGAPPSRKLLPRLRQEHAIDFCVVNVENAAGGFGVTPAMARQLLEQGADVMTSGNHIWDKKEIVEYITKENLLLRPANFPVGTPGVGLRHGEGGAAPRRRAEPDGPRLHARRSTVRSARPTRSCRSCARTRRSCWSTCTARRPASRSRMGWYLDGRVSAVVGTHRHVQTADERVLPGGTAYITDLGMTGPTDGVIGVDRDLILQRFLTQMPVRFEPAKGPSALHGVVIVVDPETGRASDIRRLRVPA